MSKVAVRPRYETEQALPDAERLRVEAGAAGITPRRLAEEAGANHGLVHRRPPLFVKPGAGRIRVPLPLDQPLGKALERAHEHLLHHNRRCFQAIRRMDAIPLSNFVVFPAALIEPLLEERKGRRPQAPRRRHTTAAI